MVVFIDESYQRDSAGICHYALAGFGVNEFRYRALQAAIYQLIRQYFDVMSNYEGDTWRQMLTEKIIVQRSADDIELKADSLLRAANLRRFGGDQSPHVRLVSDVLNKVHQCRGTCFGVLVNPSDPTVVKDCSAGCPRTYRILIEKVGRWMEEEYPGTPVTIVLDTEHNAVNLPLSRTIADFLYKSAAGKKMKQVFPAPFWIDSKSMAGAQVADPVAHILMNSMMPEGERKPLRGLWEQVNSLRRQWDDGVGGTISRLRKTMADEG